MGFTILLVSPEAETRDVAALLLRRLGHRVLEARHAFEAQLLYDECAGAVDLLLTEALMTRTNGHALADSLRERAPALPVLFLSDASYERMTRRVAAQKRLPFLIRPFTPAQLAGKVREALDGRRRAIEAAELT